MSKLDTITSLKVLLKKSEERYFPVITELIRTLIGEFTESIELKGVLEPYSKIKSDWEGSFVFDRPIDFNYESTGDPRYNSYINIKTGEKFSVGDYVEVHGDKGTITKFGIATNGVYAHITICDKTVYHLSMLKKVSREEYWVHKPTEKKYKITKEGPVVTYYEVNHTGGDIILGIKGTFPCEFLDNSKDWLKIC